MTITLNAQVQPTRRAGASTVPCGRGAYHPTSPGLVLDILVEGQSDHGTDPLSEPARGERASAERGGDPGLVNLQRLAGRSVHGNHTRTNND
jgi:hypothetical protein